MVRDNGFSKLQLRKRNYHSDAVASLSVDIRRRVALRQREQTATAKFNSSGVNARELAAELRRRVRGEVRFDDGSRALSGAHRRGDSKNR